MSDIGALAISLAAGWGLGTFFFGGLWWTVRRGLSSPHPAVWFVASTLARMAVLLPAFYDIALGGIVNVIASLLGVLVARWGVSRLTRLPQ